MDNELDVHPSKRLGRLPAKVSRKALQFADFFQFVKLPKETKHWVGQPDLPLRSFGNTMVGDCTRAKQAMATVRMELLEQDRIVQIGDDEVVRVYFDMTQRLYGGGDTGAYEEDALNDWRRPETTFKDVDGHAYTIDAFLLINPKNQQEVKAAISLAGAKGIAICFDLPLAWQHIEPPDPWTVPTDGTPITGPWLPGSWGGHSMWCSDYDDFGILVDDTWNHPRRHVSWDAVAVYMDEAHLVIDSVDAWSQMPPAPSGALDLDAVVEAVNTVSEYAVQEKKR